jgi:hypothetical protein
MLNVAEMVACWEDGLGSIDSGDGKMVHPDVLYLQIQGHFSHYCFTSNIANVGTPINQIL